MRGSALALVALVALSAVAAGAVTRTLEAPQRPQVTVELEVVEKTVRVLGVPFQAWTFDGTLPGPIIRVTQGTELTIVLRNGHTEPHSFHTHFQNYPLSMDGSSHTLPLGAVPHQHDDAFGAVGPLTTLGLRAEQGMNPIGPYLPRLDADVAPPGGTFTYRLLADEVGTFVYHCHVFPVGEHIGRGLFGLIMVYPPGWSWEDIPPPQLSTGNTDAWVTDAQGKRWYEDVVILTEVDLTTLTDKASVPATAGKAKVNLLNFRAWNDPYYVGPVADGTPMRVIVANLGEEVHSWHVHGHNFDVVDKFDPQKRVVQRLDALLVAPGQSFETTLVARHPGFWFVHDHMITNSYAGMIGWLNVLDPEPG